MTESEDRAIYLCKVYFDLHGLYCDTKSLVDEISKLLGGEEANDFVRNYLNSLKSSLVRE